MMATDILHITNPCLLFPNDEKEALKVFRSLSMKCHPDHDKSAHATDVFVHIQKLYTEVLELIKNGKWEEEGVREVSTTDGKKFRFRYKHKTMFELGEVLECDSVVAYFVDNAHKKLYDNAIKMIGSLKYKNDNMEKEVKRYMPRIVKKFTAVDGRHVLVLQKTHEVINLQVALDYFVANKYPEVWDKHAAWIQSRLNNILCYLNYCGIVHNGISAEAVYISPEFHSICLLGGWWYAVKVGDKMLSVPKKLYNHVPPTVLDTKIASQITDGELVKALGRETLKNVKAPQPFVNWLKFGASGKPVKDFEQWMEKVLPAAYGERKFIKLNLNAEDVYG